MSAHSSPYLSFKVTFFFLKNFFIVICWRCTERCNGSYWMTICLIDWMNMFYTYICIYIVIHIQTVSLYHNSSVWLDTLGAGSWDWNPSQLYVRLIIILLSQQANHISSGIIRHYVIAFVCLHFCLTRVLNSFKELCIMQVATINSFIRVLNPCGGAYILSSTDRLFRCITTLQYSCK